jgi:hypothetical protein
MRIVTDGAEFGDMLSVSAYGSSAAASTAVKRTGSYSYKLTGDQEYIQYSLGSVISEFYVRYSVYRPAGYGGKVFEVLNGGDYKCRGNMNSSGLIQFVQGFFQDQIFTTTIAIPGDAHTLLEIHYKSNGNSGYLEVKVNGVLDPASISGTAFVGDTVSNFRITGCNGTTEYFDDIAINTTTDTDGKGDTGWIGDGHIELLVPNGNSPDGGWTDDFTGSDGNSTDNYALVDEIPPSSSDYIQSETIGHQDRYAFANFDATGKRIKRVWTEARGLDTSSGGNKVKLGLRVSGTDYLSTAKSLAATYGQVVGEHYKVNPATSAEWSDSELNAAQSLVEVAE